ncbi:MAG TPA: D-arabinono-1,4-lactone oxidase [Ktedonobacteraceae bacterium]|nr:D-arabinono-1,4-lactone oxidase [Ktedonobacteraceae bacterium]
MAVTQGERWQNWSGSVQGHPRQVVMPGSVGELTQCIGTYARDGRHVRVVGSGHSFTPLVQSDDVLMSLDNLQGVESIDADGGTVTVLGGTKLKMLGEVLLASGLAQENLGDINVQSIAGAISTGTHGTGINFGSLATQVEGLTLVTASGELLECSPDHNPQIFKAAQVSLGTLGVIARVKLRVVPAKILHYQGLRKKLADCLEHLEEYKQENMHFEFFWFPYTEWVQAKFLNPTGEPPGKNTLWGTFNKIVLENWVYGSLCAMSRAIPGLAKSVCKISGNSIANVDEIDYSHRLFSTPRMVHFQEMEYNIPAEHLRTVITEIQQCIERHQFAVNFPLECRFVHSDDIWLSPAYQRESAYVAVHMYKGMPYHSYFSHIEEIFRRYQGRPHWGKLHTRTAGELATLYPHWQDFRRIRASLDPTGMFLNDYLRALFDTDTPVAPDGSGTQETYS